jgi:rod shape-determining protein MreB
LLKNLDTLLHLETGLPIKITEDPLSTVVLGSGKALDNLSILKEVMLD